MFNSNGLKRRSIYKYVCEVCGKQRASFIYERALGKVCMACQNTEPDKNQPALFDQGQGELVEIIQEMKVDKNGALVDQRLLTKDGQVLRDWQDEETPVARAFRKTAEAREEHKEEQKQKQFNQVLDAEVEGEQTKRDRFFEKYSNQITIQKEVPEEEVVLFTFNDRAGLYVTGEYFRWKPTDFYASAEYFMDDLPLVYSAGLEVDLVLAKD